MTWTAGHKLGSYELQSPLGAGGMGEVWKARDMRLNRTVAIKRLKAEHSDRFDQEARAIAALNHPHICQIYDVGPDYLVMEYVEGSQLKGPLPPEEAVRLALQITSALEDAHSKSILHRDLKPGNIMLTPKGDSKLLDFGLAKNYSSTDETQTVAGAVMGTVPYMSPEQAEGKPLDARSEVFSFGAVLHELLSGERAFHSLGAVLRSDPPTLRVPASVKTVVEKCLRKNPAERYQSVAELRAALAVIDLAPADTRPSIAVLPFANMSRDADDEYFSDGLAEEIINALVQQPGLKVIARTSAFAFKGQNIDIRKIAETLGVQHVLEGSVRRAGDRLRITAQLILASDGSHLWSRRYDRQMSDIFEVQDEISGAIAEALQVQLGSGPVKRRHEPPLPAYEAYLKAKHHGGKPLPESLGLAMRYLDDAIVIDPDFAQAYGFCAALWMARSVLSLVPHDQGLPAAREKALRALEADPDSAEAHAILGAVASMYDLDWPEAERRFRRAMAGPVVPTLARRWYAFPYLVVRGQAEEARQHLRQVMSEDPLDRVARTNYIQTLVITGSFDAALAEIRALKELDSANWVADALFALVEWRRGNHKQALVVIEAALEGAPWFLQGQALLAGLLERSGHAERASEVLKKLSPVDAPGGPIERAIYSIVTGNLEAGVGYLEKAAVQRDFRIGPLALAYGLRDTPYWPRIASLLKLPE
jgi:serine/threonine-protein kinase